MNIKNPEAANAEPFINRVLLHEDSKMLTLSQYHPAGGYKHTLNCQNVSHLIKLSVHTWLVLTTSFTNQNNATHKDIFTNTCLD